MNISPNLFDCAVKQSERNIMQSELDKYLANGGEIKPIENVYKPKIYQDFNAGNQQKPVFTERTQKIIDSIRAGNFNTKRVVLSTSIKNFEVHATINYLIKNGYVKKTVKGKSNVHFLEVIEDMFKGVK